MDDDSETRKEYKYPQTSFKYIKGETILSLPALPSQNFTDQRHKVNSSFSYFSSFISKEPSSSG